MTRLKPLLFLLVVALTVRPVCAKHKLGDIYPNEKADPADQKTSSTTVVNEEENARLAREVTTEFYQKGVKALNQGNLEQAQDFFDRVLTIDPNHKGAREGSDFIMQTLENPVKNAEATLDPKQELILKLQKKFDQKYKNGQLEEAASAVDEILAVDPTNTSAKQKRIVINKKLYAAAVERAQEREKAEDYQGAIDAYQVALQYRKDSALKSVISGLREKIQERNRADSEKLYLEALAASQNNEIEEAYELCKQALKRNPANLQAQRMLERLQAKIAN